MDETTQRDVVPPSFQCFHEPGAVSSVATPPGEDHRVPMGTTIGYYGPGGANHTGTGPIPPGAAGETTGIQTSRGPSDDGETTFASRLPPDHPGLRLERPQPRALRRGPIIVVAAVIGLTVLIATAIAFTPRGEQAHPGTPTLGDNDQGKNVTISETVQNAPSNNSEVHAAPPKLGPPLHGSDLPAGAPAEHPAPSSPPMFGHTPLRQAIREERVKAFGSSILVDLEGPSDSGLPSTVGNEAAANNTGAAATKGDQTPAGLPVGGAGTGDPNMQQHKTDFLARDGVNTATYLDQPVVLPKSPFEVKAGTIIPASLLTAINSDLPGQIIGQVRENVYDTVSGNYLLIPQGSKLLATYDSAVSYGQERVLFCWNRLIRPDGVSISLECMPGADLAGASGATDDVNHHWWRIITGVALGTLLSTTADRAAGNVTGYQPTVGQSWAANAGGARNTARQQITQKNLAIQPTVTVRAGYSVNVIVTKDIVFPPYVRPPTP
jgi:type IV secretion system protein TrbI